MNGVPEYYELKLNQTSKGIWYCDSFRVFNENGLAAVDEADSMMTEIEKILDKHNQEDKKDACDKKPDK